MDSKRSCVVYGLASSAEPDLIRYIGQTTLAPDLRLRIHINQAQRLKRYAVHRWINHHIAAGHSIVMITLMAGAEYHRDEQRIIADYRAAGIALLNHTDGGEGVYGYKHTPAECLARGARVRAIIAGRSPEAAAEINSRISAKLKGKPLAAETRAKMSAVRQGEKNAFHGRSHSEASRIANARARAKLTDDQVREMRRRCAAGERQQDLIADYGVSQSQISEAVRGKTYWWVD